MAPKKAPVEVVKHWVDAAPVHQRSAENVESVQLAAIEDRIKVVAMAIMDATFSNSINEALAVASRFKHEAHVMRATGDLRRELEFLKMRREHLLVAK